MARVDKSLVKSDGLAAGEDFRASEEPTLGPGDQFQTADEVGMDQPNPWGPDGFAKGKKK